MQQSTKAEAEAETTKVWRSVVGFGWCVSILYSVLLGGSGWLVGVVCDRWTEPSRCWGVLF